MNRISLVLFIIVIISAKSPAQDIPLFSQKLTNSLLYNPSLAGNTFGSLTYSYRKNYGNVKGAPENHLISINTPISNYRFGMGASLYQEDVNFLRTTYTSAAFAYHVHFNKLTVLSMGVGAEYNSIGLNGLSNTINNDPELMRLGEGKENGYDVSFGMHLQTPYLKLGLATNRLATSWVADDKFTLGYFSGIAQGNIPLRNGDDLLEPYVAYRKFSTTNNTYDLGMYYTYNNKLILGVATRGKIGTESGNNIVSSTLGYRIVRNLLAGYSHELMIGSLGGYVGSANELTLRMEFNNKAYKETFRSDYKSSVNYRRKMLSTGSPGSKSPAQLKKKMKKLAPFSSSKRFQDVKKLSGGRKYRSNTNKRFSKPTKRRRR